MAVEDGVRQMAVKVCRVDTHRNAANLKAMWKEIELIASCHDRNCLQFYGVALHRVKHTAFSDNEPGDGYSGQCLRLTGKVLS